MITSLKALKAAVAAKSLGFCGADKGGIELSEVQARRVQTGSYETFLLEGGDPSKETIIFLHGSGPGAGAETNWRAVLPHFADDYHVVAPDVFGFGKTDHPEELPKNPQEWMNERVFQIVNLLDALHKDKAHLVGNSLGGVIALHLLMHAPHRFDRVVLMGAGGGKYEFTPELFRLATFHRAPTQEALENLFRWFVFDESLLANELKQIAAERLEMFSRPEVRRSYEATFANMHPMDTLIPPSALRRMNHEILLIHGYEDRFVPFESSLFMMDYLPNAQLYGIKRCGHWVQIEQKDRFVKITRDFLAQAL